MKARVIHVRGAGLRSALVAGAMSLLSLGDPLVVHGQANRAGDALARLKAGNARFVADAAEALPITAPRRAALAQGQSPYASVLSCADSRVPPEVIFHTGLGDLFVVRAAGHVPDRSVLASIEYGAEHLHTPLIVVMGHESCGAVKAAVDTPATKSMGPNLDYLLHSIRPAVTRTSGQPADLRLRAAILANVEETINKLLDTSVMLKHMAEAQHVTIVGAYYELATGRAHFSEPARVMPRAAAATTAKPAFATPTPSAAAPVAAAPASAARPTSQAPASAVAAPARSAAPTAAPAKPAPSATQAPAPPAPSKPTGH